MLAPKGLEIGDVFTDEYGITRKVTEVIPFVGYNSVVVSKEKVKAEPKKEKITEVIEEKTYIPPLENSYEDMGIKELQALCKDKGLSVRGTKAEVIERLRSK